MRGLKLKDEYDFEIKRCRIFYRCVDWNYNAKVSFATSMGRIFYRCVDWNYLWASIPYRF